MTLNRDPVTHEEWEKWVEKGMSQREKQVIRMSDDEYDDYLRKGRKL